MAAEEQSSPKAVFGVVSFYMFSALVMVMVNKWVLNSSSLPLTFLLLQLVISVVCLTLLSFLPPTSRFAFVPPRWNRSIIIAVAPVCTANVVGLAFNIYCLKLVDASFFQVARGLTLPMTVVLQSVMTGERPTWGTVGSCAIVTWGFTHTFLPTPFISSASTIAPSEAQVSSSVLSSSEAPVLGMVFGVLSAAMVAIHAVLIKSALKSVDGKTLDLAYWSNALSALALLPGILVSGELAGLPKLIRGEDGNLGAFALGTLVTGLVGFLICVAGLLSIKVTSPVTHMFSSAVRSVLQTLLGVWLFRDIINASRVMSITLILTGSLLYTWIKSRPKNPQPQAESTPMKDLAEQEGLLESTSQNERTEALLKPVDLESGLGSEARRRSSEPGFEKSRRD
ncbi:hypothetical protein BD324DRAFT_612783 [Kockovaella imperatae]|uniref:GDP-mannose transporter n=1 Tax=Kockovaella imperatae TaxID=4999 RepID=A0A1Y1UTP9_9TREE|nr:hypothetical protein BD324DRAFT_612783 [Kockovaella imperatae]ORX40987.1 hypothetical protein BD324DRAFT_612783 [Kockovaella imperatae]